MAAFRANQVCMLLPPWFAMLPGNSSDDELTFDKNVPLAGYKEQGEGEDEEAIGDVESVSSQTSRSNSGSKKKTGRRPTWTED